MVRTGVCKDCKKEGELAGNYSRCPSCSKEHRRKWRTPDKTRKYNLKSYYNITPEQFDILSASQGDTCALCERYTDVLHIDHDHLTGEIRGLLCLRCNTALGVLGDSVEALERVIKYLKGELNG